ncbi:MAG: histidine phosphatase family protein [Pseudomonadota bacterium]
MASIYLVRHGQASFGAENYDQLSALGARQCRLLGEWWRARGLEPGTVLGGPMRRHRQSYEGFCAGFAATPALTVAPGLAEFDHENVIEVHRPEFADKAALVRFLSEHPRPRQAFHEFFTGAVTRWHSGGADHEYNESWPHFRDRVVAAFHALLQDGGDVLVFTSGGAIAVMLQDVLGLDNHRTFALNGIIANSSVTRLLYRADEVSLHSFNATAHLDIYDDAGLITYR